MAFKVIVTPSAAQDLEEYASYISIKSPGEARKWLAGAWDKIFSLSEMPLRFAVIDEAEEIGQPLRDVLHHSHRIVYRVKEDVKTVEILRVWHAAREQLKTVDLKE